MLMINGAQGEGGGQIFRTSLTLAMCLQMPVRINNIRAGRAKPGLLRQHLTCLHAAQTICAGEVIGDALGSTEVIFRPGKIRSGRYRFAIGSAGSTSLVFQTVFLPLALTNDSSEVYLEGGTHNGLAPSFDFIENCFGPLVGRLGFNLAVNLERFGFYPAGGGAWLARIGSLGELRRLQLMERGARVKQTAVATSARIPAHVTQRELAHIQRKCLLSEGDLQQRLVDSMGPGNIVSLRLHSENVTEVVECVGEKHLKAERVAGRVVNDMQAYVNSGAAVGEYLADQILLPLVMGEGGAFSMGPPSQHFLTNVNVIKQFMDVSISVVEMTQHLFEVRVK